jgi:hypothetical protein
VTWRTVTPKRRRPVVTPSPAVSNRLESRLPTVRNLHPFPIAVTKEDTLTVRLLNTEEVAERFRTSPSTVRYRRHLGSGPAVFASAAAFSTTRPSASAGGSRRSPLLAGKRSKPTTRAMGAAL